MKLFKKYSWLLIQLFFFSAFAQTNIIDSKGFKQGAWKKMDSQGKVEYVGVFKNNVPVGTFIYYYPSGRVKAINIFERAGKHSRIKLFNDNEKNSLMAVGVYVEQKKDSVWKLYNEDQLLVGEEVYVMGKREGCNKKYFTNGKLCEVLYWQKGVKQGEWKTYFESGNPKVEASYNNGELDNKIIYYFPNGNKETEGTYINALKSGDWYYYLQDGRVKMHMQYTNGKIVKEEKINGVFTDNYPNDTPREIITWQNGKKNGPFKLFYEGEYVKELQKGEDGFPDETIEYIKEKRIMGEGEYKDGKLNGKITYYKKDGSIEDVQDFVNGELKSKGKK